MEQQTEPPINWHKAFMVQGCVLTEQVEARVEAEARVDALSAEVQSLRAERDRLNKALLAWEDREAAVCPEDVGFEEVIQRIGAERDTLREALAELVGDANRLRDRQLGGTLEEDCSRSIAAAKVALASPQTAWYDGLNASGSHRFDCHECRVRGVIVDEEGCCRTCGHDAARVSPQTAEETQG